MTTDQIAAEAARQIEMITDGFALQSKVEAIIKAAIEKAVAAEREAVEQYKVAFEAANDTCKQFREQLDAERESRKDYQGEAYELNLKLAVERDYGNRLTVQLEEAQQQLAAERG